jgi:transposase
MSRRVRLLGWTRKKKSLVAGERDEEERAAWREAMAGVDASRLVFVDETAITIAMTRRYARAPRGKLPYGYVPRTYGRSITLIAPLSLAGIGAVMTLEGAAHAAAFEVYVRELFAPTLTEGQIVVIDNVTIHESAETRRLIEARSCELRFLPPYSSDFCPVDLAFAKIKEYLRGVGARTPDGLLAAVAEAVDTITPEDAAGYFRHCGYLPAAGTGSASQTKTGQGE